MASCQIDRDCVDPGRVCYVNVSWLPQEVLESGEGQCLCNAFYGWSGPNCDQLTLMSYFFLASCAVQACFAVWFFLRAFNDSFLLVRYRGFTWTSLDITLAAVVAGMLLHIVWRCLLAAIVLSPGHFNKFLEDDEDAEKFTDIIVFQQPVVLLSLGFTTVACMNVSVMWIEIAMRVKQMRTRLTRNVTYYRRSMFIFQGVFILVMALFAILNLFEQVFAAGAPFLLVLMVLFIVGRRRLAEVLKGAIEVETSSKGAQTSNTGSSRSSQQARATMEAINLTSLRVIFSITLAFVFGALYILFNVVLDPNGSREFSQPGKFGVAQFALEGLSVSLLMMLIAIEMYARRNTYITIGLDVMRTTKRTSMRASFTGITDQVTSPFPNSNNDSFALPTETSPYGRGSFTVEDIEGNQEMGNIDDFQAGYRGNRDYFMGDTAGKASHNPRGPY